MACDQNRSSKLMSRGVILTNLIYFRGTNWSIDTRP